MGFTEQELIEDLYEQLEEYELSYRQALSICENSLNELDKEMARYTLYNTNREINITKEMLRDYGEVI